MLCSQKGEYINGECQCNPGWKGKECQLRHDECEVPDCNGHGHCVSGKCSCVRGYKGKFCEEGKWSDCRPSHCHTVTPSPFFSQPHLSNPLDYSMQTMPYVEMKLSRSPTQGTTEEKDRCNCSARMVHCNVLQSLILLNCFCCTVSVGIFSCCCANTHSFCLPLSFHMSLFKCLPHIHLPNEECDQFSLAETISVVTLDSIGSMMPKHTH